MNSFSKKIDEIDFGFKKALEEANPWYHITYTINEETTTFRMYRDEKGIWKIAAQQLPQKIQALEIQFNNAIIENEGNV